MSRSFIALVVSLVFPIASTSFADTLSVPSSGEGVVKRLAGKWTGDHGPQKVVWEARPFQASKPWSLLSGKLTVHSQTYQFEFSRNAAAELKRSPLFLKVSKFTDGRWQYSRVYTLTEMESSKSLSFWTYYETEDEGGMLRGDAIKVALGWNEITFSFLGGEGYCIKQNPPRKCQVGENVYYTVKR